ncbi:MAG TPA: hypothetical protein VM557_07155 [Thermoanaerobaculia bacterium]|nr:hypothetical protein [Thermoanaerobaculia bacterium]
MKPIIMLALAATIGALPIFRAGNSHRMTEEGRRAFAVSDPAAAARSFALADQWSADPIASFNAGTASIAAGNVEEGSRLLAELSAESGALATDALFNQGGAAMLREQWDDAISSYIEVLKRSPRDLDAKRNLEIALRRNSPSPEESGAGAPQPQPSDPDESPEQETPSPSEPEEGETQMPAEEILRSIAQQEREEIQRMRREKAPHRRVLGW